MLLPGKTYIARHGETVFNAARRIQGDAAHTPLTIAGFNQANAMGAALHAVLGSAPPLNLWSSSSGRALQTLAIICEHLGLDWHRARQDDRLVEIGMGGWGGRYYYDVTAEFGPVFDPQTGLLRPAPDGEQYVKIADRLKAWVSDAGKDTQSRLVIMHGISSRVLRGLLTGAPIDEAYGVPIAPGLPQGSVVVIENDTEQIVTLGSGEQVA